MNQLIEVGAIRSLIRRSFPNQSKVVIGELLQNAQRSEASEIQFSIEEGRIIITDNGSGIDDFADLLVLGKSKYDPETTRYQHPLGVGFNSLLALDRVKDLTIESKNQRLSINIDAWWDDYKYAQKWRERIEPTQLNWATKIEIHCERSLSKEWLELFDKDYHLTKYRNDSPSLGYSLVGLEIFCNDQKIDNGYPCQVTKSKILKECKYEGCNLKIYSNQGYRVNFHYINWYGQLIDLKDSWHSQLKMPFSFVLEVKKYRPLDLQAPVRQGPIYNYRFQEFIDYLVRQIAKYFQNLETTPHYLDVYSYHDLRQHFPSLPSCPWYVANCIKGYEEFEEKNICVINNVVLRYDGSEELIDDKVCVENEDNEWQEYEGYESFVTLTPTPLYQPTIYDYSLLKDRIKTIFWRPGNIIETKCDRQNIIFRQPGEWAVAKSAATTNWQPITKEVFALTEPSDWGVDGIEEWILGCPKSPAAALETFSLAGYTHGENENYKYYQEQIQEILIQLQKNVLQRNASQNSLKAFIARLENIAVEQVADSVAIQFTEDVDRAIVTGTFFTDESIKQTKQYKVALR